MAATADQLKAAIVVLRHQAEDAKKTGPTLAKALLAAAEELAASVRAMEGEFTSGDGR